MRPCFHPRLINNPFEDPVLFIPFLYENRAILFDLGDIHALLPKEVLKISHVFVTHTHMDHFVGFERMLRLFLGREKHLRLYGPKGFLKNVEGKLSGYSWNLVGNYQNRFLLDITEVQTKHLLRRQYLCRKEFLPAGKTSKQLFTSRLLDEPALSVSTLILDHGIPCLAFSIKETFHVNIIKDNLHHMGLEVGPWIRRFKEALYNEENPNSIFDIGEGKMPVKKRRFRLGDLKEKIAHITPGQKITYITDAAPTEANLQKMAEFARDSDLLFIEAAFMEKHRIIAEKKHHLTARQAGNLAGKAGVKRFTIFHFSPRYMDQESLLQEEAMKAYEQAVGTR